MSREFIRADYLKVELELSPALPAREIAIAFLSELEFEVFEPNEKGLVAHIPKLAVNRKELDSVRDRIAEIAEISKIKLTESIKITLKLADHVDEEIYFQPKSEKTEKQNVKLNKGQGFLRIKHDGDSEKIIVFSNNKLLGPLSKYRNDTIVLDAGKNNVKLIQDDVKKEQSFKISIDAFEDWEVTFVESVDINISF